MNEALPLWLVVSDILSNSDTVLYNILNGTGKKSNLHGSEPRSSPWIIIVYPCAK